MPGSHWVNEARLGYNRLYQPTYSADHNESAASLGINDGVTNPLYGGLPRLKIKGFGGIFETLGGFKWPKVQGPDDRFQIVDHLSYTFGKHALKFGGELHRDSFSGGAFGDGKGYIIFSGGAAFSGSTVLEDFFAGDGFGRSPRHTSSDFRYLLIAWQRRDSEGSLDQSEGGHLGRQVKVWPDQIIFRDVLIPWLVNKLASSTATEAIPE
jgi:hypothetical protein